MNRKLKEHLRKILPRSIAKQRILGGPLRGHALVTSWHDYPAAILGSTERPLLSWFQECVRLGETWLDVGAHFGYTALALAKLVGAYGRVFAFEPMISTAGCLAQSRRLNGLEQLSVIPVALGQPESFGMQLLPTTRGMADSTIKGSSWLEAISVARLDWLWPRICGKNPQIDGIKIDVQGMELDALTGMRGILQKSHPKLVVEIHKGVSRPELLHYLADVGYKYPGHPVEPIADEIEPRYLDDRSYAFVPSA